MEECYLSVELIKEVFEEYCEDIEREYTEEKFKDFLNFLGNDVYDWINGNLKYFFEDDVD